LYKFIEAEEEKTTQTVEELAESLLEMENCGAITDRDVEECMYYLQKISDITGIEVDFDDWNEEYRR
jgi:hypothetical protein